MSNFRLSSAANPFFLLQYAIIFSILTWVVSGGNTFCKSSEEGVLPLLRLGREYDWGEFQNWAPFGATIDVEIRQGWGWTTIENIVFDTEFYDFALLEDGATLADESPERCSSTIYRPFDMYKRSKKKSENNDNMSPFGSVGFPRYPGVEIEGNQYSGSILLDGLRFGCNEIEIYDAQIAGISRVTGITAPSYHEFSFYSGGVFGMAFNSKLSGGEPGVQSPFLKMITDKSIVKNVGMVYFKVVDDDEETDDVGYAALGFGADPWLFTSSPVRFMKVPKDELQWALPTTVSVDTIPVSSDNTRVVFSTASVFNTAPAEDLRKLADMLGAKKSEGGSSTLPRRYELPCKRLKNPKFRDMKMNFRIEKHNYFLTVEELFVGPHHGTVHDIGKKLGLESMCQMNIVESDKWRLGLPFFRKYVLVLDVGDGQPSTTKRIGLSGITAEDEERMKKKNMRKGSMREPRRLASTAPLPVPSSAMHALISNTTASSSTEEVARSQQPILTSKSHRRRRSGGRAGRGSGGRGGGRGKSNAPSSMPPPPMVCKQGSGGESINHMTRWAGGSAVDGDNKEAP